MNRPLAMVRKHRHQALLGVCDQEEKRSKRGLRDIVADARARCGPDTPNVGQAAAVELSRNVELFRGGLVFKAHELLYHSTLGTRVMKKQ